MIWFRIRRLVCFIYRFSTKIRISFIYYWPWFCYIVDIIKTVFYHVSRIGFCFFHPFFHAFFTYFNAIFHLYIEMGREISERRSKTHICAYITRFTCVERSVKKVWKKGCRGCLCGWIGHDIGRLGTTRRDFLDCARRPWFLGFCLFFCWRDGRRLV